MSGESVVSRLPLTKAGFEKLKTELDRLKDERPSVIKAISDARVHGDLSENAEYHAARERQSFIEGRIMELESKIARADVIDIAQLSGDTVKFGARVELILFGDAVCQGEQVVEYQIVGEGEADVHAGMISITSPIARALIGKKVGDCVEVWTPKGEKLYKVVSINFF